MINKGSVAIVLVSTCYLPQFASAEIADASEECGYSYFPSRLVESTPSRDFSLLEAGAVVRHERTGLEWQRCALGQTWNGTNCGGFEATRLRSWQQALNEAGDGWRLPNVNELRSLVERCRQYPAINRQAFPDTPSSADSGVTPRFWTSSPYGGDLSSYFGTDTAAWYVDFENGSSNWGWKNSMGSVRLVRGGE